MCDKRFDIHNHILPKSWPDFGKEFGYGGFVTMRPSADGATQEMWKDDKFFRAVNANCYDLSARLADMNAHHIGVQALSTVPVMFSYWAKAADGHRVARFLNNDLAESCRQHPTRFVGLGTLPLRDAERSVEELKRCMSELNMAGFQIGSSVNGMTLDHPHFEPVWHAAEETGAALFVHPWDMHHWDGRLGKHWLPWLVGMPSETAAAICSVLMGGVLERHPRLRLCFAHGAGAYPMIQARVNHGYKVRPDLCATECDHAPSHYHKQLWADSLTHDIGALKLLQHTVGTEHIILGTDYPFPLGDLEYGDHIAQEASLSDADKKAILWSNAFDLLSLDATRFV